MENQSPILHFSHSHPLELTNHQSLNICSGCKTQTSGQVYKCKPCNFTLHISCAKTPRSITHPSHPMGALTLLPIPAYPSGLFTCNGCRQIRNGFSYHCDRCHFDLDIFCASRPLSFVHQCHPVLPHPHPHPHPHYNSLHHNHQAATTWTNGSGGNALMGTMSQGFVNGAAQQVGQSFWQSITNNGSDSGNSFSFIFSIGSSILQAIFGDSYTQN